MVIFLTEVSSLKDKRSSELKRDLAQFTLLPLLEESLEAKKNGLSDQPVGAHELILRALGQHLQHRDSAGLVRVQPEEPRQHTVALLNSLQGRFVFFTLLVKVKEDSP